ncbi:hypothetical protein [Runella sp.]|uniref:hypothetical protein n=1 Tax=Runella sp. TaxID=1960881 RepID=UPI0030175BA7
MFSLSKAEARKVIGGGSATAKCNNGTTISCSGAGSCELQDGAGTGNPGPDGSCTCGTDSHKCQEM